MPLRDALRREFSFIRGNYAILVASWILMDFSMELPATYYALYVLELGATETILGMIGFSSFLALAAVQFPGGYLADKFGRRWLVSSMTFAVALCYIFFGIAPSWYFILIGTVVMSLCHIYQPALMAMIADAVPSERRGMGFSLIMLIVSASTTPGPFVARILYIEFGLVNGMRIGYGIVTALFLIAAFLRLRLTEPMENVRRPGFREILSSFPISLKESLRVWRKVPRSMFYLFLSLVTLNLGWAASNLYLVVYAVQQLGIDEAVWPLILTGLFVAMIVLAIPVGKVVDRFNRKIPLLVSYVSFAAGLVFFMSGGLSQVFVALVLFGVANILINAAYGALEADLTPKAQRGKVMGFSNFSNDIVMAIGNLAGGILYEHFSPQLPFFFTAALLAPAFIITIVLVHEPENREE
ncbi:MAG: MFS transporter [Candidatus Bathyarchaeota archaeon]|nr:MFS transporter [Candidatus Bathyarchaeota archaeon]